MKTLAKTFAAAALIAVSTFTMAAGKPEVSNPKKAVVNLSTADLAIDHYVAVMTEGQSAGVEQLFTADFSQKVQASEVKTNSRSEVISFLKKQKGEQLNCKTSTTIVQESADYMIAKVTMQFEGFTKTDLVTLVNDGGNWKISQSINSYK
ncbi:MULTISPECIES: nuclear transport factor 2 family protein [unclassified Sphingobacterium]|uniref:nuclear transport factor 2 family protein n=1 Tax=unclassified Sphingobacterium TaxID=2609468 RepID=UPI00143A8769|nr:MULTISPECIES: nuclear transport factor 2 family protein [unclassified Sphingobacterium]NJI72223.1 nuclear transport factor 2 family protein [Sphingobacterium sp. B16(2022)]QQD12307.1 nuclear transport factor 2 family protein [Sphingobacterium sp. UDSM-2020]